MISRASTRLATIKRLPAFFGFPQAEEENTITPPRDSTEDATQVLEPFDADRTQVLRRPGRLGDRDTSTETTSENPSPYRNPSEATEER